MRRIFNFKTTIAGREVADGAIELDQSVIDQAKSEEFKKYFYDFDSDDEIAALVARQMIVFEQKLSEIEVFMMDNDLAKIVNYPSGFDDFEFEAEEVSDSSI
jgi:hypothetical protein